MSPSLSAKKSHTLPGGELPDPGDHWGNRMWEINADSTGKCLLGLVKSGGPSGDSAWDIEQNEVKPQSVRSSQLGVTTA